MTDSQGPNSKPIPGAIGIRLNCMRRRQNLQRLNKPAPCGLHTRGPKTSVARHYCNNSADGSSQEVLKRADKLLPPRMRCVTARAQLCRAQPCAGNALHFSVLSELIGELRKKGLLAMRDHNHILPQNSGFCAHTPRVRASPCGWGVESPTFCAVRTQ